MSGWKIVQWAEAGQVAALMGHNAGAGATKSPPQYFDDLLNQQRFREAVLFVGHALPRYEGIVWAAQALREFAEKNPPDDSRRSMMTSIMRWIDNPADDQLRRELWDVASVASDDTPETFLASAIYFSGGSISPPDQQAILPAPEASARFATGSVLAGAFATDEPDHLLRRAAELGAAIAAKGLGG